MEVTELASVPHVEAIMWESLQMFMFTSKQI